MDQGLPSSATGVKTGRKLEFAFLFSFRLHWVYNPGWPHSRLPEDDLELILLPPPP